MKFAVVLLIIILVVFFLSFNNGMSRQEAILYGVIKDHGEMIKEQNRVQFFGTGGAIPNKIHKFMIRYSSREQLSIDQTRELLFHLANDIIRRANAHSEWIPYFNNYPVTLDNLELSIGFFDEKYKDAPPPNTAYASLSNGTVDYHLANEKTGRTCPVYEETYEEALEKLGKKDTKSTND